MPDAISPPGIFFRMKDFVFYSFYFPAKLFSPVRLDMQVSRFLCFPIFPKRIVQY